MIEGLLLLGIVVALAFFLAVAKSSGVRAGENRPIDDLPRAFDGPAVVHPERAAGGESRRARKSTKARSFRCGVAGESFDNDDGSSRQRIIERCAAGDAVTLTPEPDNPYDRNAVKVETKHGQIGYLKRAVAARMVTEFAAGAAIDAKIASVAKGDGRHLGVRLAVTVRPSG